MMPLTMALQYASRGVISIKNLLVTKIAKGICPLTRYVLEVFPDA
jgi:hypothetical protein